MEADFDYEVPVLHLNLVYGTEGWQIVVDYTDIMLLSMREVQ